MHCSSYPCSRAAVAAARLALDAFDQREADAVVAWSIFGEGPPPPINQARRAALARHLAEAERAERRTAVLPH